MPTISGKYKFNSTLPQLAEGEYPVTFTSNGGTFAKFAVEGSNFYYLNASNNGVNAYLFGINFWNSGEAYRDIDFGSTPQTISDTLYNYFVANAAKEETQTTFDLSTLPDISGGTHTVKVKAKANGYSDSEFSQEIEYTKVQGFTLTLNVSYGASSEPTKQDRVKIGSAPTSDDDYDYRAGWESILNKAGTSLGKTVTVNNVFKYYTWTTWTNGTTDWQTAAEHTEHSYTLGFTMTCLTGDTLITMSDGSEKRIDTLRVGDKILSYNPETDYLEEDEVTYSDSTENKQHDNFDVWTFSDGTIIKTIHRHRFYNVERNAMVYMDEWNIGEHGRRKDGVLVTFVSHENVKETINHYTIFTKNQNYFANGLLSGNRYTKPIVFEK